MMRRLSMKHKDLMSDEEQRANLTKLADFLEKHEELTESTFDMNVFHGTREENVDEIKVNVNPVNSTYECGTTACAAGHGPAAGVSPLKGETWPQYCKRAFGVSTNPGRPGWNFIFCAMWRIYDNSARGAATRIRYALEHGAPYSNVSSLSEAASLYIDRSAWLRYMKNEGL